MGELKVLTYNVKLLPEVARAAFRERPVVRGASTRFDGAWWERWMSDSTRTGRLAQAVAAGGFDVVCLQEVFDEDRRAQLVRALRRAGYRHQIPYSGDDDFLHEDSGLFFASRHPIKWSHFEEFTDSAGEDAWADKGITCAALDVGAVLPSTALLVFNTHLQAHGRADDVRARRSQIAQLGRKVTRIAGKLRDPKSCAVLLCGDFNVPAERLQEGKLVATPEYRRLCDALGHGRDLFRSKRRGVPGYTSDSLLNRRMHRGGASGARKRLDYVFAIDSVAPIQPEAKRVKLRKLKCTAASVEPFYDAEKDGHLSDHFGVAVTLTLPASRGRRR